MGRPGRRCLGWHDEHALRPAATRGAVLSCCARAACASGTQAKRWLPRCHSAFSHCARVVLHLPLQRRCAPAPRPAVVRTTTQRSPAGACGADAQKRSPSCCQASSATCQRRLSPPWRCRAHG